MAGILDNEFMKLLLSGSPYMQQRERNRREDELAGRVQGLIGEPEKPLQHGFSGPPDPGTGLLGNKMTQPQFAARLMGIPGLQGASASMMNTQIGQQGAMDRQQQAQDWAMENVPMVDRMRLKAEEMRARTQQFMGLAKDDRAFVTKQNEGLKPGVDMVNKMNKNLPTFSNGAVDWTSVKKNGALQHQMIMTYAKSILGNEAVMSDDRNNIVLAGGAPGYLKNLVAQFNGGILDIDALKNLASIANENAAYNDSRIQANRKYAEDRGTGFNLLPYGGLSQVDLGGGDQQPATGMPADVAPYNPAPSPRNPTTRWGW